MASMERTLLEWMREPAEDRGLHFAGENDAWEFCSYRELALQSLTAANALRARGLKGGSVVAIVQRTGPAFWATLFGALTAGVTACSVAPPFGMQRADAYQQWAGHLLATARPDLVIADHEVQDSVRQAAEAASIKPPVSFTDLISHAEPGTGAWPRPKTALLQFTSGSTGRPRCVRIPPAALQANVTAMRAWLDWTSDSAGASWLPAFHDMGLIGTVTSIAAGSDTWLMQPADFIRKPLRYLACLSDHRVSITPMPNFGLAYMLRRVKPADLEGMRFDSLRAVVLGAERIDPRVLEATEKLLGPFGLDRRALLPAYGGAEATLAVTGVPPGEGWTTARLAQSGAADSPGARIVGCGRPLSGVDVSIEDDDGEPVTDGVVGEIVVKSPSLATGYHGDTGASSAASFRDDVLHSGDAGFMIDGQLFVLGRLGDGIKVRGRMIFAESIETFLAERGIPERRAAILLGVRDGVTTAAAAFEVMRPDWPAITAAVLREWIDDADMVLINLPRGGLAVTSSGKVRRRVMWKALCDGTLGGERVPLPAAPFPGMAGTR